MRKFGDDEFAAYSASTDPGGIHPLTVEVMRAASVDLGGQRSKHPNEYVGTEFDCTITGCDRVGDQCPKLPGDNERIHWGFDVPVSTDVTEDRLVAEFRRGRNGSSERIRIRVAIQKFIRVDQS